MNFEPAPRGADVPAALGPSQGLSGAMSASASPPTATDPDCLGSTCLKWGNDGELTSVDLRTVLERLCAHDPQACRLLDGDSTWT